MPEELDLRLIFPLHNLVICCCLSYYFVVIMISFMLWRWSELSNDNTPLADVLLEKFELSSFETLDFQSAGNSAGLAGEPMAFHLP